MTEQFENQILHQISSHIRDWGNLHPLIDLDYQVQGRALCDWQLAEFYR